MTLHDHIHVIFVVSRKDLSGFGGTLADQNGTAVHEIIFKSIHGMVVPSFFYLISL